MKRLVSAVELEQLHDRILSQRHPEKPCISICGGMGCHAYRSEDVSNAFKKEIKQQGLNKEVELKVTGCHGFCERGPLMVFPKRYSTSALLQVMFLK